MVGTAPNTTLQGIEANYYNITDGEGMPIAGLLVLLDRLHRPVRAEVHLYDDIGEEGREVALTQGRTILQERYYSRTAVPMRVLHTFPERAAVSVTLPEGTPAAATRGASGQGRGLNWRTVAGIIGGAILLAALLWGLSRGLGNRATTTADAAPDSTTTGSVAATPAAAPAAASDLPPSRNARGDIQVGSRVAIVPGYQLTLRSEPGPEAGEEVGYMVESQTATVIEGPVLTQGDSDTIVWWRIQLDDGQEAWAAANTSLVTLLVPAE